MKRWMIALLLALPLYAPPLFVPPSFAGDKPKKSEADAMLDFYVEAAKPVAEHEKIAELLGPWKATTKLWFEPGKEAMVASGPANGRKILGGRFVAMEMNLKGDMPSESLTMYGFDRRTGDYTLVGFDDLGTYYITAAGKHDAAQKGVVLNGSYSQPPKGDIVKYRFVWTRPSASEHLFTLYFEMGGKDVRVAETHLVRE